MLSKREILLIVVLSSIISTPVAIFSLGSKLPNTISQLWFALFIFILLFVITFLILFITMLLLKLLITLAKNILKNKFKSNPCTICKKLSSHYLNFGNGQKRETYCRLHLLEKFLYYLLQYQGKCIALKPQLKGFGNIYTFTASEDMKKYNFSREDMVKAEEIFTKMKSKCDHCQKEASVVFYNQENYSPNIQSGNIFNLKSEPIYLCKECFWNEIKSNFQADYQTIDGEEVHIYYQFTAPYGKSGIFCSDTLL